MFAKTETAVETGGVLVLEVSLQQEGEHALIGAGGCRVAHGGGSYAAPTVGLGYEEFVDESVTAAELETKCEGDNK